MKQFWSVSKILFKQTFGISNLIFLYKNNKAKLVRQLIFIPLIVLALLPILTMIVKFYETVFNISNSLGQGALVLAIAFTLSQSMALVFGFFYMMSHFYFAKDTELLIPLPLKPSVILGSKFLMVVISEYVITLPLVIPALYIYLTGTSASLLLWLPAIVLYLLLPIIPLAISSVFVILMMRVTNVANGRGLMRIIGAFSGILIYSVIQWTQFKYGKKPPGDLTSLLAGPNGLANSITRKFPPSMWAARGISGLPHAQGWEYYLLFIAATVTALFLLLLIGNKFFYKGLIGGEEVSAKKKKVSALPNNYVAKGKFKALFLREWKSLVRSASFLTPVLVNIIIIPIAVTIPLLSSGNNTVSKIIDGINGDPSFSYLVIFAAAGLITWISSTNSLAATGISREGQTFWISKTLPVSAFTQLSAKLLLAMIIPIIFILILVVIESVFLKFGFALLIAQILVCLTCCLGANCLSLIFDLMNPKLKWSDPQQVMKRNTSVIISAFTIPGLIGITGFGIYHIISNTNLSPFQVYVSALAVWLIITLALFTTIKRKADYFYGKIDV